MTGADVGTLSRDRFKKGAAPEGSGLSGGSFGGATPADAAPVEEPAAPVAAPVTPAAPPVEVKAGELDPVARELLSEIPDRPATPAKVAAAPEKAAATPEKAPADDLDDGKKKKAAGLLLAGLAVGALALLGTRLRPAAPAALAEPEAPAAPAPVAPAMQPLRVQ